MQTTRLTDDIRLSVCGLTELCDFRVEKVTHVLSIIDPALPDPADFEEYDPHHRLTLRFHDVIEERPGFELPQPHHVEQLLAFGDDMDAMADERPTHLLIHCHMGISRSTAAMATLLARKWIDDEPAVFERLVQIRPQAWPNSRMIGFADDLLHRRGRLVAALQDHYRRQAAARPDLAQMIRNVGRAAEVPV